jgi:hypothetical protein
VTAHESKVLEAIGEQMQQLTEEVHIHVALTREQFAAYKVLCDERHGLHPGRLAKLDEVTAQARGGAALIKWLVPVGVSLLSIGIGFALHYI